MGIVSNTLSSKEPVVAERRTESDSPFPRNINRENNIFSAPEGREMVSVSFSSVPFSTSIMNWNGLVSNPLCTSSHEVGQIISERTTGGSCGRRRRGLETVILLFFLLLEIQINSQNDKNIPYDYQAVECQSLFFHFFPR